jgi:2-polyprenyl-3-methyl-5-hydroxy-6-metoxy-1,4-benzoquinol methylase
MQINSPHVESPLVQNAPAKLVTTLPSQNIVSEYRRAYDIDVGDYFAATECVAVYECQATGYQFYHPFHLTGSESLYRQLQKFQWNYKDDKWEYKKAISYLTEGSRVLDVGCGRGAFVKKATQSGLVAHGLELNALAAQAARDAGLSVSVELIAEHIERGSETYDAVCCFQVLEHIAHVREFIDDCLKALKPGGTFIIGVPNNEAFLRHDGTAVLNMPPHHMGLWSRKSLSSLPNVFPLQLKAIEFEPLQELDWYMSVMQKRYLPTRWIKSAYHRLGLYRWHKHYVANRAHKIPGHTVLAVFEKRAICRTEDRAA